MTRTQLENPADLWAGYAKNILTADSPAFPFTVYAHRHLGAMDNNRVQVTAQDMGRASDHASYANIGGTPQWYYDHRQVRLAFAVISDRASQQNTDNHAYAFGRIGYLCSKDAQRFANANVGNFAVVDILETPQDVNSVDEKTDRDRSVRNYEITYVVPPSVMAAAT